MALFWPATAKSRQVSVAIIEAPSLMHARMRAALLGLDDGARFAEGHMRDAKSAATVASKRLQWDWWGRWDERRLGC
jgi:hypothetical protein